MAPYISPTSVPRRGWEFSQAYFLPFNVREQESTHSHVIREAITDEAERLSMPSSGLYWIEYDFSYSDGCMAMMLISTNRHSKRANPLRMLQKIMAH
jgi:hypothetical protein